VNPGDTFAIDHLWFVCTIPDSDGQVVIVSLTTETNYTDPTCRLVPGDHPFVSRPSVIAYQRSRVVPAREMDELARTRGVRHHAPASSELLVRIRAGALVSPYTPRGVRRAIAACPWRP
jgi:hypothetical protein